MRLRSLLFIAASVFGAIATQARSQDITIYVWQDDKSGPLQPAEKANVLLTPSLRLGVGGKFTKTLSRTGDRNQYVASLAGAPSAIDVRVHQDRYHPLPICDLAGNRSHVIHVTLLHT